MRRLLAFLASLFTRKPTPYVAPPTACVHGIVSHNNGGDLDALKALGVSRTYYYCLRDNERWGAVMDDGRLRPAWDTLAGAM